MRFTCKLPDHLEMDAPFETEIYISYVWEISKG